MAQEQSTPCMARPAFDVERFSTGPRGYEHARVVSRHLASLSCSTPAQERPCFAQHSRRSSHARSHMTGVASSSSAIASSLDREAARRPPPPRRDSRCAAYERSWRIQAWCGFAGDYAGTSRSVPSPRGAAHPVSGAGRRCRPAVCSRRRARWAGRSAGGRALPVAAWH